MKKKLSACIVIILVIVAIVITLISFTRQGYNHDNAGKKVFTSQEVYLRKKPHGKTITKLSDGEILTLTGYSYEYPSESGETSESWIEVVTRYEGVSGWIPEESIDWQ